MLRPEHGEGGPDCQISLVRNTFKNPEYGQKRLADARKPNTPWRLSRSSRTRQRVRRAGGLELPKTGRQVAGSRHLHAKLVQKHRGRIAIRHHAELGLFGADIIAQVEIDALEFEAAGFTHVALVQVGGDTQEEFITWAAKELLPALRAS